MDKWKEMLNQLNSKFRRREEVIRGLILGLLTGSNVLLIGPPGTAKSMLVNSLVKKLDGMKYFSYLMTKFTRPDEIIGPFSLKGLEKDELDRVLEGRLAEAHVAFLDEVFNSNSGCLNAVLSIMNEKKIINGTRVVEVPLIMLVGAANELPSEISAELSAFYDRFLLRYEVGYLDSARELQEMIMFHENMDTDPLISADIAGQTDHFISINELRELQSQVRSVRLGGEVLSRVVAIVCELRKQGLAVSDRRVGQCCQVLKANALLEGRDVVIFDDLVLLRDMFWHHPKDKEIIEEALEFFQKPVLDRVNSITREARKLFDDLASAQWSLGTGTNAGVRLLEIKNELIEILNLYEEDVQLAGEIRARVGQVDNLVTRVFQNMLAGKAGVRPL